MIIKVFNIPNQGSFIRSGLMLSYSLHPIKYLKDCFVPYGSFLEIYILLASNHLS